MRVASPAFGCVWGVCSVCSLYRRWIQRVARAACPKSGAEGIRNLGRKWAFAAPMLTRLGLFLAAKGGCAGMAELSATTPASASPQKARRRHHFSSTSEPWAPSFGPHSERPPLETCVSCVTLIGTDTTRDHRQKAISHHPLVAAPASSCAWPFW